MKVSYWIVTSILQEEAVKMQAALISKFIKIAGCCLKLYNYNTLMELLTGLNHNCISRLKNAWALVPDKYHKRFERMQEIMSPQSNYLHYRQVPYQLLIFSLAHFFSI